MSKNSFDKELLEFSSVMHSGYLFVVNNSGKVIALLTIIVSILVTFTDISFGGFSSRDFTTTLAMMLASSYIVYFSLEESGEALGRESEEYLLSLAKYRETRGKIDADSVVELREFCAQYVKEELAYRRKSLLMERGYSNEEYSNYKKGGKVERKARRTFRRADSLRAIHLTPSMLLSGEHATLSGELESPHKKKLATSLRILLPSTACMIFTVSVILTAKGELTPSVVIDGILKLSALPIIGFKAYGVGYNHSKNEKTMWLDARERLLSSFIAQKNSA